MAWNILKKFGVWSTILRWREPFIYRIRLKRDVLIRLGISLAVGIAATAGFLFLFAAQANPDPAQNALFGLLVFFPATAVFLFWNGGNVSGDIRLCEEGIVRNRHSNMLGHMEFQETSWPYEAIHQATIVPGQAIGRSFSLLFLSSPGSWEMIGVPRKISLNELTSHFRARGIEVQFADVVPDEFTEGLSWAWPLACFGVSLPLIIAGMMTYAEKAPLGGPNLAAAQGPNPPPRFVPPQVPRPQAAVPKPRDFAAPPPPVLPNPIEQAVAPVIGDNNPAPPTLPEFARPGGRRGLPGPPGVGPRFGPGVGLPPSFAARRGGSRAGGAAPIPGEAATKAEPSEEVEAGKPSPPQNAKESFPAPPSKTGPPQYNPPRWLPGQPTALLGGPEGFQFENCDRSRKTVLGFRYRLGQWANQPAVAQLDPLYDRKQFAGVSQRVIAREGYVVGGLQVVSGDLVTAVRVIFVREQTDGGVDKTDHYLSDWIGDPGEGTPKPLGHGRTRVIGVCGRRGAVLNAIALVLDRE